MILLDYNMFCAMEIFYCNSYSFIIQNKTQDHDYSSFLRTDAFYFIICEGIVLKRIFPIIIMNERIYPEHQFGFHEVYSIYIEYTTLLI